MNDQGLDRRHFLKGAVVGGAAAAATTVAITPPSAQAQQTPPPVAAPASPGYAFLNLDEAAFVEALVDHMVPADELTPKGTDIGINIYIDRALAGSWGKGDRLYMQGPWKVGVPSQGYQLPLTPAQLYRAGVEATNAHCQRPTARHSTGPTRSSARRFWSGCPAARSVLTAVRRCGVLDHDPSNRDRRHVLRPIYGGNRNKAGWRLIGFPGVIAVHRENVEKYRDKNSPPIPSASRT
jgi:gluconate 2-dehydrogenase gamma chain